MNITKTRRGLVLLAHGARNPEWAAPFRRVQQMLIDAQPDVAVELAFLEFMAPDLAAAVGRLAQRGLAAITIVPLFFGQSGHVLRDVPPLVDSLRQAYPDMTLRLVPAAGEDAGVLAALTAYCSAALAGAGAA